LYSGFKADLPRDCAGQSVRTNVQPGVVSKATYLPAEGVWLAALKSLTTQRAGETDGLWMPLGLRIPTRA